MAIKEQIFSMLQQRQGEVSGELIAQDLGVSRVAIWKHVKALKASGLPIKSSPKGYSIDPSLDSLHPLTLATWKNLVHYFRNIPSTMVEARRLAWQGCPHFTIVVADQQGTGRGRMQRVWQSEAGGLYFTVVLRPQIPVVEAGLVSLLAATDMAYVLRTRYGVAASLKWPNDIHVNGRKICGVLSFMETEDSLVSHISVGIGLNVNNSVEKEISNALSLKSLLGYSLQRQDILLVFLDRLAESISSFDPDKVITEWKAHNCTLGRMVKIETSRNRTMGEAVDLNHFGGLVVRLPDGTDKTVNYGDCFVID